MFLLPLAGLLVSLIQGFYNGISLATPLGSALLFCLATTIGVLFDVWFYGDVSSYYFALIYLVVFTVGNVIGSLIFLLRERRKNR